MDWNEKKKTRSEESASVGRGPSHAPKPGDCPFRGRRFSGIPVLNLGRCAWRAMPMSCLKVAGYVGLRFGHAPVSIPTFQSPLCRIKTKLHRKEMESANVVESSARLSWILLRIHPLKWKTFDSIKIFLLLLLRSTWEDIDEPVYFRFEVVSGNLFQKLKVCEGEMKVELLLCKQTSNLGFGHLLFPIFRGLFWLRMLCLEMRVFAECFGVERFGFLLSFQRVLVRYFHSRPWKFLRKVNFFLFWTLKLLNQKSYRWLVSEKSS